jgi:hypothetical protein
MSKPNTNHHDIYHEKVATNNIAIALFLVLVIGGSTASYNPNSTVSLGDVLSSIAGLLALLGLITVDVLNYQKADEFQQVVRLKAAAMGFAAVIAACFASEVLINLNVGSPRQYLQIIFIGGVLLWVIIPIVLIQKTTRD